MALPVFYLNYLGDVVREDLHDGALVHPPRDLPRAQLKVGLRLEVLERLELVAHPPHPQEAGRLLRREASSV